MRAGEATPVGGRRAFIFFFSDRGRPNAFSTFIRRSCYTRTHPGGKRRGTEGGEGQVRLSAGAPGRGRGAGELGELGEGLGRQSQCGKEQTRSREAGTCTCAMPPVGSSVSRPELDGTSTSTTLSSSAPSL